MAEGKADYQDFFNAQNEINALFVRNVENILSPEGITVQQAMTLKTLKEQDQMCRMSDLAAMRFLTPAAATGIVDRLIHLGLVERKFDDNDRRVILLALTPRGEAALSTLDAKIQAMMRRFFEHVSESDRAASLRMVRKLKEYLKEELSARKGK
ncbi:MAG: MarR family winged helix-turn-helix transcriptional regulator [Rectinemataceae bacterium]